MASLESSSTSGARSNIAKVFKGRRGRKGKSGNASTPSLVSHDSSDDHIAPTSTDSSAFEKLKSKVRTLNDTAGGDRTASPPNDKRITALFHGRRNRRESAGDEQNGDALGSGATKSGGLYASTQPSEDELGTSKSIASSLLTEDSDDESQLPVRPTLSPHQSHAGYLTLSSPLIAAETVDSNPSLAAIADDPSQDTNLATGKVTTLEAHPSEQHRSPSPSPVGRLKEAFTPSRRGSKVSGDNDSVKSGASGGGGLGGFLAGGRKGTSRSRRGSSIAPDEPSQATEGADNVAKPKRKGQAPPSIVTAPPSTPPNVERAPTTLVTPPTPVDAHHQSPPGTPTSVKQKPADGKAFSDDKALTASPESITTTTHRRARSSTNPPSKLSNAISAPLTPTAEEVKTPQGTIVSPGASGGFFSSFVSAAQNAGNSLTNIIGNPGGQRSRSGTGSGSEKEKTGQAGGEEVILTNSETDHAPSSSVNEKRQPAVETLGSGDLTLSHLGISDYSSEPSPMNSKVDVSEKQPSSVVGDDATVKVEDNAATRSISAAYVDKPNGEKPALSLSSSLTDRPRSITGLSEVNSPSRSQSGFEGETGTIRRAGSVRSRLSGRRRRHRGSSATTGTTIVTANGNVHGLANPKRNKDFHNLFRSVPEDDYLIEDYSAALQREILLQGRLYVSEGHICFSSNILGWVTNLVISFDEVVSIEKKSTAVIFPNAIVIQTLHARNVFASLVSRDSTYELIIGIWKISHPNLKSSQNGVALNRDAGTGDKTEKAESVVDGDESVAGSEDVYDEDDDDDTADGSFVEAGEGSIAESDQPEVAKTIARKASAAVGGQATSGGSAKIVDNVETVVTGAVASTEFPGPLAHGPTDCGDAASHYDKLLVDTNIPAPVGKVYSMMFGPASGAFMRKFLSEDQKCFDIQLEDDKKGLDQDHKSFDFSYIKPLNASIGPRQTKCIINHTLEQFDLERVVTVHASTQNPDVPSGNVFLVKTRYCLTWAAGNSTRLLANYTIEWTGKSWIKGPIEKGTNDGQTQYAKDLAAALRAAVSVKTALKGRTKGKGRRRKELSEAGASEPEAALARVAPPPQKPRSWGPLDPLRSLLGPLADVIDGIFSTPVMVVLLSTMLFFMWFRQPGGGLSVAGLPGVPASQRIAAYEELWRREEGELWRWLEERTGLDSGSVLMGAQGGREDKEERQRRKRVKKAREMEARLQDENMSEGQMLEALKVTKDRLEALEMAVGRKKREQAPLGGGGAARNDAQAEMLEDGGIDLSVFWR